MFFGGELPQKIRNLKYFGNSIVTYLEITLHHACRELGFGGAELLQCFDQLNVTADFFEICEPYKEIDCSTKNTQ